MFNEKLIEMGRAYGLTGFALFKSVIFPGPIFLILVGIRFCLGVMWLTLIVAETISAHIWHWLYGDECQGVDGNGYYRVRSIVLYALFGKLSDVIARYCENRWLKWNM